MTAALVGLAKDELASIRVILHVLASAETLFGLCIAAASPIAFYYAGWAFPLSWSALNLTIVFPLSLSLSEAFKRRERAVALVGTLRASAISLQLAHTGWRWPGRDGEPGRSALPEAHAARASGVLRAVAATIGERLSLPRLRLRHQAATDVVASSAERALALEATLLAHASALSGLCEEMKEAGMPSNEASRIRAYATRLLDAFEQLKGIKEYATPLGLRAFARLYIQLTPVLLGPYWANVAGAVGDPALRTSLAFAAVSSTLSQAGLLLLFNLRLHLEDPFDDRGLDSVRVVEHMAQLQRDLAPPPPASASV